MIKKILLLIAVLLNFSCSSKEELEESVPNNQILDSLVIFNTDTVGSSNNEVLYRDDLVFAWDADLKDFTKSDLNFSSIKNPHINVQNNEQIDTIEVFSYKESKIEIYHAKDKDLLVSSDIRNKELLLSKGIVVGIDRQQVCIILDTKSNGDTLKISDFENNTNVSLIFTNNILTRIIYSAYID